MDIREINNDDESNATIKTVFGSFTNWTDHALDLRKSFVSYNQTYLLYLWLMLDRHDLMKTLVQQLYDSVLVQNGATGVTNFINVQSNNEMFCATKN